MSSMGRYCKAYPVERLREFAGWVEKDWTSNGKSKTEGNAADPAAPAEPGHFYVQENYIVTADIFLDEKIVFDRVDDEWRNYCRNILEFRSPFEKENTSAQPSIPSGSQLEAG